VRYLAPIVSIVASAIFLWVLNLTDVTSLPTWLVLSPLWLFFGVVALMSGSVTLYVWLLYYRRARAARLEQRRIQKMVEAGVDLQQAQSTARTMRALEGH
jgi:membrane protein implicated in regulation of membrane protease activity